MSKQDQTTNEIHQKEVFISKENTQFIFLKENEEKKLETLWINYVTVGQWELANAVLHQIINLENGQNLASKLLNRVLPNLSPTLQIPQTCLSSNNIPSPAHLAWLVFIEYSNLKITLPEKLISEIEFEILLFSAFCDELEDSETLPNITSNSILKELRDHYKFLIGTSEETNSLSDSCLKHLKNIFAIFPSLGSPISRHLSVSKTSTLTPTGKKIQLIYTGIITSLLKRQQFEEACSFLQFLYSPQKEETSIQLRKLFETILKECDEDGTHDFFPTVYTALLSNFESGVTLLHTFSELEDEHLRQRLCEEKQHHLLLPFQRLPTVPSYWVQFYSFLRIHKIHFIEYLLTTSLELLQNQHYEETFLLLQPFPQLKPLVIALAWDQFADNILKEKSLLDTFWNFELCNDSNLNRTLQIIHHSVALTWWILEQYIQYNFENVTYGTTFISFQNPNESLKQLFNLLQIHSLPYLCKKLLPLIPIEQFTKWIKENPNTTEKGRIKKHMDLFLIQAYYIVRHLLKIFHQSVNITWELEELESETSKISKYIQSISSVSEKLKVLQLIYASLFLQTTHLKTDPNTQTNLPAQFIANLPLVRSVLKILQQQLSQLSRISSSQISSGFQRDFSKLQYQVESSSWRLEIIDKICSSYSLKELLKTKFINLMLSNGSSLFVLSLRNNYFAIGEEIIKRFSLSEKNIFLQNPTEFLKESQTFHNLVTTKFDLVLTLKKEIESFLSSLPLVRAFYICADLAIILPYSDLCHHLISKALQYATQLETFKEKNIDCAHIKIMASFLSRLQTLLKLNPSLAVCHLLPSIEGASVSTIEDSLTLSTQGSILLEARDKIKSLSQSETPGLNSGSILNNLISSLEKENQLKQSKKVYISYFSAFLNHLVVVARTLDGPEASTYFQYLQQSPQQILRQLVIQKNDYATAEKLANILRLNLAEVLIVGFLPTLEQQDNQFYNVNTSANTNESKYTLSFDILDYLNKNSPLLAGLACIFCSPSNVWAPGYVHFALPALKNIHPIIANWIALKGYAQSYFSYIVLHGANNSSQGSFSDLSELQGSDEKSNIQFTNEEKKCFELVNQEELKYEAQFFSQAVSKQIHLGNYIEALSLLDNPKVPIDLNTFALNDLENSTQYSDTFLKKIIDKIEDKSVISKYIIRMNNIETVATLTIQYYEKWSIDVCIDLFLLCKSHLPSSSALYPQINTLYEQMKIYKVILKLDSKWQKWQQLAAICKENPLEIIRHVLELKQHEVARKLEVLFQVPNVSQEIEEKYLLDLFESDETDVGLQILQTIKEPIQLVLNLIEKIDHNVTCLKLIQYLLKEMKTVLSPIQKENLLTKELSLQILNRHSPDIQKVYREIIDHHQLIIESLIMSEQTAELHKIFMDFPQIRNDEMVLQYAVKAMTISSKPHSIPRTKSLIYLNSNNNNLSIEDSTDPFVLIRQRGAEFFVLSNSDSLGRTRLWKLSGDPEKDKSIREEHFFPGAPSINLAKTLLELCSNYYLVGQTSLKICQELSSKLNINNPTQTDTLVINLLTQLYSYAKLQFQKAQLEGHELASSGVAMADTYLSHVELLQSLLSSKYLSSGFALKDFGDPHKARILRNKLIQEDRMKLAIEVASRCNIEKEPVWAAWGLALLRMGRYPEAKEKFNDLSENSSIDTKNLLNEILQILEAPPLPDHEILRQLYSKLARNSASKRSFHDDMTMESYLNALQIATKPHDSKRRSLSDIKRIHTLDDVRLMQCIYYLKKYGNSKTQVQFWIRHHLVEDACKYIFSKSLPHQVFIEDVVQYCLSHGMLQRLLNSLKKIGTDSSDPSYEYISALCKHLHQKKAYKILLEFLKLINDNARIGITLIQLFHEETDFNLQIKHLENAKEYFMEALTKGNNSGNAVMTDTEISRQIKAVTLQIQITKFFSKQKDGKTDQNVLSIFGTTKQRVALAEQILLNSNFDLTFQIIQDYKLPLQDVYVGAISQMAHKKQFSKINELLKNVKGTITDYEWDQVVEVCINIYARELEDPKTAEKFIVKLVDTATKIRGYIACGKLRQAYLLAVQSNNIDQIKNIRDEAKRVDNPTVFDLCQKFLSKNNQVQD